MKSILTALIVLGMVGVAAGSNLRLADLDGRYSSVDPQEITEPSDCNQDVVWISKKLLDQLLRAAIPEHEVPIFRESDGNTYFNTDALIQKLKTLELRIRALEFNACGCSN